MSENPCLCTKLAISTAAHVLWILKITTCGGPQALEDVLTMEATLSRTSVQPASRDVIDWRTSAFTAVSAVRSIPNFSFDHCRCYWPNDFTARLCHTDLWSTACKTPQNRKLNLWRVVVYPNPSDRDRSVTLFIPVSWRERQLRTEVVPCSWDRFGKISYRVSRKMLLTLCVEIPSLRFKTLFPFWPVWLLNVRLSGVWECSGPMDVTVYILYRCICRTIYV